MKRLKSVCIVLVLATAGFVPDVAPSQEVQRPANLGSEIGNLGLAPFLAVPAYALTDSQRAQLRAVEDRQLLERRALEDQFARDLRTLLVRQAEERETLLRSFVAQ